MRDNSYPARFHLRDYFQRELDHAFDSEASAAKQIDHLLEMFAARCKGIYGLEDLIARAKELGY